MFKKISVFFNNNPFLFIFLIIIVLIFLNFYLFLGLINTENSVTNKESNLKIVNDNKINNFKSINKTDEVIVEELRFRVYNDYKMGNITISQTLSLNENQFKTYLKIMEGIRGDIGIDLKTLKTVFMVK